MKIKHCQTTIIGIAAIILAVWSFRVHWVPGQSFKFNIVYAGLEPIGMILLGILGVLAADGRHVK